MTKLGMIALKDGRLPSLEAICRSLSELWPAGQTVEIGWGDGTSDEERDDPDRVDAVFFRINDAKCFVALMPGPIPWSDLEGPCATSVLWADAEHEMKQHNTHFLASVMMPEEADPINGSVLLTQLITATIEASSNVIGIYYGDATLVVQPQLFKEMATTMLPDAFPLFLWVDIRVGVNDRGYTSGFTTGMHALGHMELETEDASDDPGDLRERLMSVCDYLLQNGPIIKNGNTIGQDENERIRVVYSDSVFGHEQQVMRLVYERLNLPEEKKPWWKVF